MRNFILLICAIFTLFSINSIANDPTVFAGKWAGKGTYILNGKVTNCKEFNFVFSATTNKFNFVSGNRVCDDHSESFYPVAMTYKEGNVFFNNMKVGTYTENQMDVFFRAPDGNTFRNWRMTMRRDGNTMLYEESRTMDGETTPMISFAGLMTLQN